jgi:ribosome maturation factor RimP
VVGRIAGVDEENITLEIRGKSEQTIQFSNISKANLMIDLEEEFRKR